MDTPLANQVKLLSARAELRATIIDQQALCCSCIISNAAFLMKALNLEVAGLSSNETSELRGIAISEMKKYIRNIERSEVQRRLAAIYQPKNT